jgi:hypothetical protein
MKEELANELYDKFPTVLTDTCEVTGIVTKCYLDIGDGWYDLITTICDGVISNQKRHEANTKLLIKMGKQQETKEYYPVKAVQIKEKFGGLRFYVSGGDEFDRGVIFTAEAMSRKICETCGQKGKTRDDGWMITLCDEHAEQRRWRKENESKTTILPDSGQMG